MSLGSAEVPTCARHDDHAAVARCRDCGQPLCARCTVELSELGTFCWSCASRRGGLRARRRLRADPPAEAPPVREPPLPPSSEDDLAVRRFEEHCEDREPRPLISGLTERLEQVGADPADVVDDDELTDDIARLQRHASEDHPSTHRWFRRS